MSISVINELPPNRHPVKTSTLSIDKVDILIPRIHEHCMQGKQIFWVCCLIDESDKINCQDVTSRYEYLKSNLPNEKIGVIHGRMKSSEKDEIMNSFKNGDLDILVSTSVIEVGVDVPNAFLIVIENAERYGLAQLHQLRGRVGRGKHESFCMLLYSHQTSTLGKTRLNILKESNDGFYISKKDLEIRGPGDILGTRQIGELSFKVANIIDDAHLYEIAKQTANTIFEKHPDLVNKIIDRWFPYNSNIEVIS
jgi:ATP-dependent DNA helicase RecG